jgi:hypothetical protein
MGSAASAAVPPPPPPAQTQAGVPPYDLGLAGILPPKPEGEAKEEKKVDYLSLPCPLPFEEIQREALSSFTSLCPSTPYQPQCVHCCSISVIGQLLIGPRLASCGW